MIGPVGFAETISTWMRSRSAAEPDAEVVPRGDDLAHAVREPRVGDPEVHESRAGGLGALGDPVLDDLRGDLVGDLARRPLLQPGELECDVRRVVAVLGVGRALERRPERRRSL